ncbi:hypothetical protein D9758_011675 [Tetrapyrgos nigripes]|uniref:phytol kinase n=1 Tax=Tetrapyrgos nigripes TaxID=182062 RepID=A0A8H5GDF3_9AGAR|nr:hypothetical protein D9758_011675 [Tetrapyrgos nigripes]
MVLDMGKARSARIHTASHLIDEGYKDFGPIPVQWVLSYLQTHPPSFVDIAKLAHRKTLGVILSSISFLSSSITTPATLSIIENNWVFIDPWISLLIRECILKNPAPSDPESIVFITRTLFTISSFLTFTFDSQRLSPAALVNASPSLLPLLTETFSYAVETNHTTMEFYWMLVERIFLDAGASAFQSVIEVVSRSPEARAQALLRRLIYELQAVDPETKEVDLYPIRSCVSLVHWSAFSPTLRDFHHHLIDNDVVRWLCRTLYCLTRDRSPFPKGEMTFALQCVGTCLSIIRYDIEQSRVLLVTALDHALINSMIRIPLQFGREVTEPETLSHAFDEMKKILDIVASYLVFSSVRGRVVRAGVKTGENGIDELVGSSPYSDTDFWSTWRWVANDALGFQRFVNMNVEHQSVTCSNPQCSETRLHPKAFKYCSGCRLTWYCSYRCQKSHWKNGHREFCLRTRTPESIQSYAQSIQTMSLIPLKDRPYILPWIRHTVQDLLSNDIRSMIAKNGDKFHHPGTNKKQLLLVQLDYRENPLGFIVTTAEHHLGHMEKGSREFMEVLGQVKGANVGKHLVVKALVPGIWGLTLITRAEFVY